MQESSRYTKCERFNQKYNLTSSNKKIDKALNMLKKLNNKILKTKIKAICLQKQRKH
jgi:hypothetical protein